MIRKITFSGMLVDAAHNPLVGRPVELQVLTLADGWRSIGESSVADDGQFKNEAGADGFEDITVAPRFQLMVPETDTVVRADPELKLGRGNLTLDFGTVVVREQGSDDPIGRAASDEVARLRVRLVTAETDQAQTAFRLKESERALEAAIQQQNDLQLQLSQLSETTASSARIADLAGEVASSLGSATSPSDTGGFQIGEAKVTLKGYLVGGGDRFKPLDIAEGARGAAAGASEISFSIQRASSEDSSSNTMPDLVGLTPASAQRTIRPLGVTVQIVETPGTPAGAVLKQHPAAGSELVVGTTVILQVAVAVSEV